MVFAYNYEVKAEFFDKFYQSENINLCKGDDFGVVEESVVNISAETYVSAPVSETSIPEIKVQRVPASSPKNKNSKLMGDNYRYCSGGYWNCCGFKYR